MDGQVQRLVDKAWFKLQQTPLERRLIIGIGGIPASGKTTLSRAMVEALNARHAAQHPGSNASVAAFIPMDGYHLTRAQLSAMPDPARAHARRGAEFTFDAPSFLKLIQRLREPLPLAWPPQPVSRPATTAGRHCYPAGTVLAPSFDHAVKDPTPDDIAILPTHRALVLEGNYLALDREPWRSAAALMDEVWFVHVDFTVARKRLVARHLAAGIARDHDEADRRAVENDLLNGKEIVTTRLPVDEIIESKEDWSWM